MPIPKVYGFPVKRPGFITRSRWIGGDDDLMLEVFSSTATGGVATTSFETANTNEGRSGEVCLPGAADINDLDRDTIISHIRMATFISKTTAGSFEWTNAFVEQEGSKDFQLAIGSCAIIDVRQIDDVNFEFDIKKKSGGGPTRTIMTDHDEMSEYSFTPSTQLKIIAGAIKLEFPSYVHEYPSTTLSASQKQDILDFVDTLEPWV